MQTGPHPIDGGPQRIHGGPIPIGQGPIAVGNVPPTIVEGFVAIANGNAVAHQGARRWSKGTRASKALSIAPPKAG